VCIYVCMHVCIYYRWAEQNVENWSFSQKFCEAMYLCILLFENYVLGMIVYLYYSGMCSTLYTTYTNAVNFLTVDCTYIILYLHF